MYPRDAFSAIDQDRDGRLTGEDHLLYGCVPDSRNQSDPDPWVWRPRQT
jgi:hypothetical protein